MNVAGSLNRSLDPPECCLKGLCYTIFDIKAYAGSRDAPRLGNANSIIWLRHWRDTACTVHRNRTTFGTPGRATRRVNRGLDEAAGRKIPEPLGLHCYATFRELTGVQ
jgi:hypothetical protein